jgi:hypothetical protein
MLGNESSGKLRTILEHSGEFQHIEGFAVPPYAELPVKNIMLSCEFKRDHDWNHKRKQKNDRNRRENDVAEPLHFMSP